MFQSQKQYFSTGQEFVWSDIIVTNVEGDRYDRRGTSSENGYLDPLLDVCRVLELYGHVYKIFLDVPPFYGKTT